MATMGESKSSQGSRVQQELEMLRSKQLAKNQRDRLKDLCAPLTTPEEAQAFLATMRDKSHQREFTHKPTNLSADGMDAWFLQQREREKEMRKRRKEAEELLRGYRGAGRTSFGTSASDHYHYRWPLSPTEASMAGSLDDSQAYGIRREDIPRGDMSYLIEKEGEEKDDEKIEPTKLEDNLAPKWEKPSTPGQEEEKKEKPQMEIREKKPPSPVTQEEKKVEEEAYGEVVSKSRSGDSGSTSRMMATNYAEDRPETVWRNFISSDPDAMFQPEAGRYHLYCSYACPGSHRALITLSLKGLHDIISVTYVHPTWRLTNPEDPSDKHRGWVFGDPNGEPFANTINRGGPFPAAYPGNEPDPHFDAFSIRDVYEFANDTSGKYTIPLLWDKKHKTIVNNESSDIAYMFNSCFNGFAENPELDLYTEGDYKGVHKLKEVSEWLSPLMIHGVYRCGFAKSQRAYDKAINELCVAFDKADGILQRQRYLTGDALTDADIRLFVSLLRFDEVYSIYFRANARLVMLTPSLLNFCREIYQMPGVARTCSMEQIKAHFFCSHAEWNKYSVIPRGFGFMEMLEMPHNRGDLSSPSMTSPGSPGDADDASDFQLLSPSSDGLIP